MDTKAGELVDMNVQVGDLMPPNLNRVEYGQKVEVKGVGHFEITKIDIKKQRLVLKPVPSPMQEDDLEAFRTGAILRGMGDGKY